MSNIGRLILCGYFLMMACSCASQYAPYIQKYLNKQFDSGNAHMTSTWVLDSLYPGANTVLVRRRIIPISIHMEAAGKGWYVLQLRTCRKKLRPFVLKMIKEEGGEINFSGKISWYLKAKGKTEEVTVALYSVEETDSGRTKIKTLLKQYRRTYEVRRGNK